MCYIQVSLHLCVVEEYMYKCFVVSSSLIPRPCDTIGACMNIVLLTHRIIMSFLNGMIEQLYFLSRAEKTQTIRRLKLTGLGNTEFKHLEMSYEGHYNCTTRRARDHQWRTKARELIM